MLSHFTGAQHFAALWTISTSSSVQGDSGENTGVGCCALLQGIFPTHGSNPHFLHLLHWAVCTLPLTPAGEPHNRNRKSFIWVKWKAIAQKMASQMIQRNCSGDAWFSAQFYVLSEQRTSNESRMNSFKVWKKNRSVDTEYGSWHLARESYHQRRKSTGISGRKAFHLYFQVEYYLLLVSAPFSSIIKSDVQYIFDRLKTGCFS